MTGFLGRHTMINMLDQIDAALGALAPSPIRAGLADARRTLMEACVAPVTVDIPAWTKIIPGAPRIEERVP